MKKEGKRKIKAVDSIFKQSESMNDLLDSNKTNNAPSPSPFGRGIRGEGQNTTTLFYTLKSLIAFFSFPSRTATIVHWVSVLILIASLFVPRLLPCVDYPQHLALGEIARRLLNPNAPEHAYYQVNYFTYNALFQILIAKLSVVISIESAGRIIVASSLALTAISVFALLKVTHRPVLYASFFTPFLFAFSVGWGFVNYTLGFSIAVLTCVFVAQQLQNPTVLRAAIILILGWLCAWTHVLAMLFLCLLAVSLAPELVWRSIQKKAEQAPFKILRACIQTTLALAPLLAGCLWCIAVYIIQYDWDPGMYVDPTLEGSTPPIWQKIIFFGAFATGLHSDFTDQILVIATLVLIGSIGFLAFRHKKKMSTTSIVDQPLWGPVLLLGGAYLLTPMVFIGTHLIFPRLSQAFIIGLLCAVPQIPQTYFSRWSKVSLWVGAITSLNLFVHMILYAIETNDAARVIDAAPTGRKASAVIYEPSTFSFRNGTLVHLAGYYAAYRQGDWAFSFARYLSVPVRYRRGGAPAWPRRGWEFASENYNPRCRYARLFDLVFVKAPSSIARNSDEESKVRRLVFGQDADAVRLISHHGAYWAFDTKGLPTDET